MRLILIALVLMPAFAHADQNYKDGYRDAWVKGYRQCAGFEGEVPKFSVKGKGTGRDEGFGKGLADGFNRAYQDLKGVCVKIGGKP